MHGPLGPARLAALLFALGTTLACAASPPARVQVVSGVDPGRGRVLVAPLNLAIRTAPALEEGMAPTYRALLEHFQRQDRPLAVLDARDALRLWSEVVAEGGESSGGEALRATASRFAVRVAEQQRYGLLVFPALLLRRASVQGYQVSWDGVRRPLPHRPFFLGSLAPSGDVVALDGFRGAIAAGSLHLAIFAPDGTLVHEGIGGLDVLQQSERVTAGGRSDWRLAHREDAFRDDGQLREGVERALARPLPHTARAW